MQVSSNPGAAHVYHSDDVACGPKGMCVVTVYTLKMKFNIVVKPDVL